MVTQPSLFDPMLATTIAAQGELFADQAEDGPPCRECGRPMVRTPSGFLSCPRAHGKLIEPAGGLTASPEAVTEDGPIPWPVQARRLAKKHARRDNWEGRRWCCECGHCTRARLDGFVPRERRP